MRALITGIRGFVGPHLAEVLQRAGYEVWGLTHLSDRLEHFPGIPAAHLIDGDVRDAGCMRSILRECAPEAIFHLAGISDVPGSFRDPRLTYQVNVGGTLNLFEAVRELELQCRLVHVSSGLIYDSQSGEEQFTEQTRIDPCSPYAASKLMSEVLAQHYVRTFGLAIVIARPFNHIGPGQPEIFACADFARQIALMKGGKAKPVLVTGSLEAERDFTDVRDVVEAYLLLLRRGIPGEAYNICSGRPVQIAEIVRLLSEIAGVSLQHVVDPGKLRKIETLRLSGSSDKIRRALGWRPRISLNETLKDLLNYWISQVGKTDVQTSDIRRETDTQ